MAEDQRQLEHGIRDQPPGTFQLIRDDELVRRRQQVVMLDPIPSKDPNEPLNWTTLRKAVNFTLVLGVTVLVFTALSIQPIFWQLMTRDLHLTFKQLNRAMSVNYVGLSTGCVFFIPLAKKFGRRPVYIVSTALMLATAFWMSEMKTLTELYITNLLQGLAGATNESIVQITIADLFFVHHRGSMNGLYMVMVMTGSFLTPMAAGTQATTQGWRWSYRTMGIVNIVVFLCFVFLYEETKYTPTFDGITTCGRRDSAPTATPAGHTKDGDRATADVKNIQNQPSNVDHEIDHEVPINSWSKRLALFTPTSESIWPYYYRPFLALLSFPAVLFTGLQYSSGVVWLTVTSNILSRIFPMPPYNFNPQQIGFMSVGPFIGNLIGAIYGGFLGDRSILFFSRRNRGYYEPEMRLYILHLPATFMCGGILMFGLTIARGMHWIYPSIGGAFFGFGLGSIADASLTVVIDSYREITGDAFTGIAFLRNAISIGIPFAIDPWMNNLGLQNMFIVAGFVNLGISLLILPMILFGKQARKLLAGRYFKMMEQQKA